MPRIMIEVEVPSFDEPEELRQAVIDAYVKQQLQRFAEILDEEGDARGNIDRALRAYANNQVMKTITEKVDVVIQEIVGAPFVPTNRWGEKKGEPVTLRELIAESGKRWFEEKVDAMGRPASYGSSTTRIQWLVTSTVEEVFKSDLKSFVQQVKEQVQANIKLRVTDEISSVVAKLFAPQS